MTMDGLNLFAASREIAWLAGGKIEKIHQPEKDELVLAVRAGGNPLPPAAERQPQPCPGPAHRQQAGQSPGRPGLLHVAAPAGSPAAGSFP